VHRGAVVASCFSLRDGHHTRCPGLPDPPGLLPSGCQGQHGGSAPVPRWRGPDLRCSSLAAAGAGPATGPESAADLGLSRPGDRALGGHGPAGLGSLARPRLVAGAWALQRLQPRKQKAVLVDALDGSGRNGLLMSVRVLGQDDIHGMGLIKGLDYLDAIAQ
jgi:hypothetical protein